MVISDKDLKQISGRVLLSRMRLLINNGFFGLLLMHTKINLGNEFETAWTNLDDKIFINPEFVMRLSDPELDYVLMHELLHLALKHPLRRSDFDAETYDKAADIIVNSNIYHSNGDSEDSITLAEFGGAQPHLAPDASEGYLHSVEELYYLIYETQRKGESEEGEDGDSNEAEAGEGKDKNNPEEGKDKDKRDTGDGDASNDGEDEANDKDGKEENGNNVNGKGNKADKFGKGSIFAKKNRKGKGKQKSGSEAKGWDVHAAPGEESEDELSEISNKWNAYMAQACESISVRDASKQRGTLPLFAQRYINNLKKPQTDWRQLLTEFVQEEINDYSFTPPDRRMDDSPFFMPDFNEKDIVPGKILFAVDCSASMSDAAITACYSEICGAIEQFNGKLEGFITFFDAQMTEPQEFSTVEDVLAIKPIGGGGTSFEPVFDYVGSLPEEEMPSSIVFLTDGFAPFPSEEEALGIPVLWIINNEKATPPYGVVARISVDNEDFRQY